jgi:hypothetical protein
MVMKIELPDRGRSKHRRFVYSLLGERNTTTDTAAQTNDDHDDALGIVRLTRCCRPKSMPSPTGIRPERGMWDLRAFARSRTKTEELSSFSPEIAVVFGRCAAVGGRSALHWGPDATLRLMNRPN